MCLVCLLVCLGSWFAISSLLHTTNKLSLAPTWRAKANWGLGLLHFWVDDPVGCLKPCKSTSSTIELPSKLFSPNFRLGSQDQSWLWLRHPPNRVLVQQLQYLPIFFCIFQYLLIFPTPFHTFSSPRWKASASHILFFVFPNRISKMWRSNE